jgi:iduronate 2-sulfatase
MPSRCWSRVGKWFGEMGPGCGWLRAARVGGWCPQAALGRLGATLVAMGCLSVTAAEPGSRPERLNVLFIAVDDLRPELGCYGTPMVKSPNIDRLAARGLVFDRAYCQQAFCNPSRASLLTGRRPDTTRVYDLVVDFRTALPDVVTLPQHFMQQGYHAQGLGKIYHNKMDDAASWSVPFWDAQLETPVYGPGGRRATAERQKAAREAGRPWRWEDGVKGPFYDDPDVEDDALPDGKTAARAVALIEELRDRPFFLAVGFHKPHLPFVAPRKYWDLYPPEDLPLAPNSEPGRNAVPCAFHDWEPEARGYLGMPEEGPMSEAQARTMIHGYYAAISYADAQVGRLLDALDANGLTDRTLVILWGDHGWHLGDHGLWGKQTAFERATRSPLIIAVPGQASAGTTTDALVEFVDIFPSLVELCGLPMPEGLEGTSFVPLLADPSRAWKRGAFSQQPRELPGYGTAMGRTVRSPRYRFTEWTVENRDYRARELYDYQADPLETVNLAGDPAMEQIERELADLLHAGWRGALP